MTLIVLAVLVTSVGGLGWLLLVYPKRPARGTGQRIELVVQGEASIGDLATQLEGAGAVKSGFLWGMYARLLGAGERLYEGTVVLSDDLSPEEVLRRVAKGYGESYVRVLVPEGFTRFDIATRLERWGVCSAAEFLNATTDPEVLRTQGIEASSFEGYLFPATYALPQRTSPDRVVRDMVEAFRRNVMPLLESHPQGLVALQRDLGWNLHHVLTLASIVEKEAAQRKEQPIIAGVFLNRLRLPTFKPKRLQADPTVVYGCRVDSALGSCVDFDGRRITKSMLLGDDNVYNTYRIEGLPPGPISNPGAAAIKAVLAPAEHDYVYFVARGKGRHAFSRTLGEHNKAVQELRSAKSAAVTP